MSTAAKRHRTEEAVATIDTPPSPEESVEQASEALELISRTFAGVNKTAFDVLQRATVDTIEGPLKSAMHSLETMSQVAASATAQMITSSERYRRSANEADHLRAQVALRDEALRAQLGAISNAIQHATSSSSNSVIASAALPALTKNAAMWQRQCERLTAALATVREASASEEARLREQVRDLEKQVADGSLRTARLQVALDCASNVTAGHQQEVISIVQVMDQVVQRTRDNAGCIVDLARSRAQVRRLQKYLSLKDIAAALQTQDRDNEDTVGAEVDDTDPLSGLPPAAAVRPAMPGAAVKAAAPSFYALRVLQHKDISVAEMVDDWLLQGDKILKLEDSVKTCTTALEKLQREATKTHSLYSEERRRREAEERRVGELQRQRLVAAGSGPAALAELDKIRLQLTTLMDTNAILTVQLRHTREDSATAEQELLKCRATIRNLETAGETDSVVQAVSSLKLHYERETRRIQEDHVRVALALEGMQQKLRSVEMLAQQEMLTRGQQQAAFEATTIALKKSETLLDRALRQSNSASQRAAQKDAASGLELLGHASTTPVALTTTRKHNQDDRITSTSIYALLHDITRRLAAVSSNTIHDELEQHSAADVKAYGDQTYALEELRRALHAALTFTTVQMESNVEARKYMIDAHVADSHAICTLHEELRKTQTQLEKTTQELDKNQEFIERRGLRAAVEDVLMHELEQQHPQAGGAPSPKHGGGSKGSGGSSRDGVLLAQEELETLRTQLQEQTLKASQLKQTLEDRQVKLDALRYDFRKSQALEQAAQKRADLWKEALDAERGALRSLTSILCDVTLSNTTALAEEEVECPAQLISPPLVPSSPVYNDAALHLNEETSHRAHEQPDLEKEAIDVDDEDDDDTRTEPVEGADDDERNEALDVLSAVAVQGEGEDEGELVSVAPDDQSVADVAEGAGADDAYALVELGEIPSSGPLTSEALIPLMSLLTTVTSTLSSIKSSLDLITNPPTTVKQSAADALAGLEGGEHASMATSMEEVVAERIATQGIASVGSLVREIYETAGVIRRQRAALAGADATQQSQTQQMMIDALQRKCTDLEASQKAQQVEAAAMTAAAAQAANAHKSALDGLLLERDGLLREREQVRAELASSEQRIAGEGDRYTKLKTDYDNLKIAYDRIKDLMMKNLQRQQQQQPTPVAGENPSSPQPVVAATPPSQPPLGS